MCDRFERYIIAVSVDGENFAGDRQVMRRRRHANSTNNPISRKCTVRVSRRENDGVKIITALVFQTPTTAAAVLLAI